MSEPNQTIIQILHRIRQLRPCSRAQLYRYLKALEISPAAGAQRPQRYPADTANRILTHLGFMAMGQEIVSVDQLARELGFPQTPRIASMKELRAERSKASKRGGAL